MKNERAIEGVSRHRSGNNCSPQQKKLSSHAAFIARHDPRITAAHLGALLERSKCAGSDGNNVYKHAPKFCRRRGSPT